MGSCKSCVSSQNKSSNHQRQDPRLNSQVDNNPLFTVNKQLGHQRSSRISLSAGAERKGASEVVCGLVIEKLKTDSDLKFIQTSLKKHFLFSSWNAETFKRLVHSATLHAFSSGSVVYAEGDEGVSMFILNTGCVALHSGSSKAVEHSAGGIFGDKSLVQDCQRQETVICKSPCTVWRIVRSNYLHAVESLSMKNYSEHKDLLANVPLFTVLTLPQRERVLELLQPLDFRHGEHIILEGKSGDLFYIIKGGSVKCTVAGKETRRLGPGEFFGEQALLYDVLRTATVTALGPVQVLALKRNSLSQALGDELPAILYRNSLRIAFQQNSVLNRLSATQTELLISKVTIKSTAPNHVAIEMPNCSEPHLWIVLKGKLQCEAVVVSTYECVGHEWMIGRQTLNQRTYIAVDDTDLAVLPQSTVEQALECSLQEAVEINTRADVLSAVKLLQSVPLEKLKAVSKQMTVCEFQPGEIIFSEGECGSELFIVQTGLVHVLREGKLLRSLDQHDFFGERAVLYNEPRTATVIAAQRTKCWVLNQPAFLEVLDPDMQDLLQKRQLLQDDSVQLEELQVHRKLGSGSYGHTFLVTNVRNGAAYALKTVQRKVANAQDIIENLQRERSVMLRLEHPMVTKLVKTFKDKRRVYFLLEYVEGREFLGLLTKCARQDHLSRFYSACLCLIMEHLHMKCILYRDFKPENLIIDESGYPKLIDFGACKIIEGRTFTVIGTPHYMAPEVIAGSGYSFPADYWSVGVILFELLTGLLPFGHSCKEPYQVYEAVLKGSVDWELLQNSPMGQSLIQQLLNRSPAMRGSVQSIKNHAFFTSIRWEKLSTRSLRAPQVATALASKQPLPSVMSKNLFEAIEEEERQVSKPSCVHFAEAEDWTRDF